MNGSGKIMKKMHIDRNGGRRCSAVLLLLAAAIACSVKEDRTPCPCYLQVSFTDPEASGPVLLVGLGESPLFREQLRIEDCRPYWSRAVEKGFLTVSACKGIRHSAAEGTQITIPSGEQADSLYSQTVRVDATGEFAEIPLSLHKQFATVFLDLRITTGALRDYRFQVDGNTCGIDLKDHSPLPGPFRYVPSAREGGEYLRFRLPRQADDDLTLVIRHGEADPSLFPLGELIRDTGYSWKAEDLQDIRVTIDLTQGKVLVVTGNWEDGMDLPVVDS